MTKFNYITPIGDDFILPLAFFASDGVTPQNISGDSITFLLKPFDDLPDNDASVITVNGNITNASGGIANVTIPAATTATYSGSYYYKLKLTTGAGIVTTCAYGVITFTNRGSQEVPIPTLNITL